MKRLQQLVLVALAGLSALIVSACEQTPMGPEATYGPPPPPPGRYGPPPGEAFHDRDFAWSTVPGPASIEGVLAYRRGPIRYSCAGKDVILTPETAWSRRRMITLYGSSYRAAVPVGLVRSRTPSGSTEDYVRFVRRTTCDAGNHFTFAGLPDGSWFVITLARPLGEDGEAIAMMRRVETREGQRLVIMN